MDRRNSHVPRFPDASPATCLQAYVDEAFGYSRPGGEVGNPLPLPVQVCVRMSSLPVFPHLSGLHRTKPLGSELGLGSFNLWVFVA